MAAKRVLPPVPLVLSAKGTTWRMNDAAHHESDAEFQALRSTILQRDEYTCRACGFSSQKWLEVHHLDDNHDNNTGENLATVCSFCHLTFHLGRAGMMKEAILIWAPDISQKTINQIFPALMVAASYKNPYQEVARSLIGSFQSLNSAMFNTVLGTDCPMVLGEVLLRMPKEMYAKRDHILAGVRLLPQARKISGNNGKDVFPDTVDYWRSKEGPFGALLPTTWHTMFSRLQGEIWSKLSAATDAGAPAA